MTRLIDADIFNENIDDICNLSGDLDPITEAVRKFMKNHIDGQTTVDAIPIEFIMERMEGYYKNSYTELGACLEMLIEDWRKENE